MLFHPQLVSECTRGTTEINSSTKLVTWNAKQDLVAKINDIQIAVFFFGHQVTNKKSFG